MLKLTDEQRKKLSEVYFAHCNQIGTMQFVADELIKLLNASPTHRVVEAPEGFCFDESCGTLTARYGFLEPYIQLALKPIPKPCPPPVLEPVKRTDFITVEQVYGRTPRIVTGYNEVVFGRVGDLRADGFQLYICNLEGLTAKTEDISGDAYRICLRKWEPR